MLRLCIRGIKIRLRSAILLIIVASLYCFYQIWLEQILVNYNTIKYKDEGRGVGKIHSRQSRYKEDKIRSTLSFLMNLKSRSTLLCKQLKKQVSNLPTVLLLCLPCTYFAYYVFYPHPKEDVIELLKLDKSSKSVKKILFYTPFFSNKDYAFGFGNKPFVQNDCPVTNCFTTSDRQLLGKFLNCWSDCTD